MGNGAEKRICPFPILREDVAIWGIIGSFGNPQEGVHRVAARPLKYGIFRVYKINTASFVTRTGFRPVIFRVNGVNPIGTKAVFGRFRNGPPSSPACSPYSEANDGCV